MSDASYIHEAFKEGDLETLLMELDEPLAHPEYLVATLERDGITLGPRCRTQHQNRS